MAMAMATPAPKNEVVIVEEVPGMVDEVLLEGEGIGSGEVVVVVGSKSNNMGRPDSAAISSSTTATSASASSTSTLAKSSANTATTHRDDNDNDDNNNNNNNNNCDIPAQQPDKLLNSAALDRIIGSHRRASFLSRTKPTSSTTTTSFLGLRVNDHVYSLDEDVAQMDRVLKSVAKGAFLCWISLIGICYYVAPPGCIQRYTGAERHALVVELSILITAVFVKHLPLVWEMNVMDMSTSSFNSSSEDQTGRSRRRRNLHMSSKTSMSGVLVGGMVAQFIAISSVAIMVCFPVPVMIDPILGSRVHLIRWCEWTPCAGFLTLMMDCIDAPKYDGITFTQPWKKVFVVAAMESLSTSCGLIFPFCTNVYVWIAVMIFSCVTFLSVPIRYFEKRRLFQTNQWKGGRRIDEIELYERTRTSLALNFVCSGVWSMMVIAYFVTSCGHLMVSESWTILHDPAITMFGNCTLDLLSKCLYMALILDAHRAIFDEAKRASRRLAELRNMMGVVWENSSDTIAISVRKISGNVTSMVSPSFFRSALAAGEQVKIQDVSAVVLEHSYACMNSKRDPSTTKKSPMKEDRLSLSGVGIEIIHKRDFESAAFNFYGDNIAYGYTDDRNEDMKELVRVFTDMLVRAWQDESDEVLFEYDTPKVDETKTKYEVMLTRLDVNARVLVVRNVSERHKRFEAEKKFIFETTARQRDAEANRFTRHEVKNGILAAIEICGNIHDHIYNDGGGLRKSQFISDASSTIGIEDVDELDHTLHEVLDIILAGTMARDIINGIYVPRLEHVDMNYILGQMRGYKANTSQLSFVSTPSPLPMLLSDPGLIKCIHGNAIRNALKYGKVGGEIKTEATYDHKTGIFDMKVINIPGPDHEKLVAMGPRASDLVFSHGTRLHVDNVPGKRYHSAGDGAWIIRKCANILGGKADIRFEDDRTIFWFQAPIKLGSPLLIDVDEFRLPPDVWGIGIDDSTIQRKLLRVLFEQVGIPESRQVILGQNTEEIVGFVDFVVDFINSHPNGRFFIVADENFEIADSSSHDHISGSECIKLIRNAINPGQEMRLLALVRSANDSPQDLAMYCSKAHGVMPKVPLRGRSVRETVYNLWKQRFPNEEGETLSPISSIGSISESTAISTVELMAEVEKIDNVCVENPHNPQFDQWHLLWDKLHQLKGDLKTANDEDRLTKAIDLIEALRDGNKPAADFMPIWLRIRSDVVSFISQI